MASLTSAAVAIPSFTGLKVGASTRIVSSSAKVSVRPARMVGVKASLKDVGIAVAATAASAIIASNAMAVEVLLGGVDGTFKFIPEEFSVSSGEKIVFKNNAAFPHNIVFDDEGVPPGVDVEKISQSDYMNGPDETFSVTLNEKGTYSFFCEPHKAAGMVGKVTVN